MTATLVLLGVLALLLAGGVWIAYTLGLVAWVGVSFFSATKPDITLVTSFWNTYASTSLASLPMFIWMGEILFRTKLSEEMFEGLAPWLNKVPGREALEHLFGQLGAEQDLAHPDEHRQRGERPRGVRTPEGGEEVLARRRAGKEGHADPADDGERHGDPDAAREEQHHEDEQEARDLDEVHMSSLKSPRACRSSVAIT